MKRAIRALPVMLAGALAGSVGYAHAVVPANTGPAEQQLLLVREATRVVERFGDSVWQGWSDAPRTVLLIGEDREFLVGLPAGADAPAGFVPTEGRFEQQIIYARPHTLDRSLRTAFPVAGYPAAVVGTWKPSVESPNEWVITLIEQWFKVLQLTRNEQSKVAALHLAPSDRPAWQVDYRFPFEDPDVGNAMLLLGQSLYEFWSAGAKMPREGQRSFAAQVAWSALQNLRTVLTLKHGLDAYRFFQMSVWREGVARYSSMSLAHLVAQAEDEGKYRHAPGFEHLPEYDSYAHMWEESLRSRFWLIRTSGQPGERDSTLFHALGHGLAVLLDAISPDWKVHYFERGVWLDDLIAAALDPDLQPSAAR